MTIRTVPAFAASDGSVHATKEGVIEREIFQVLDANLSDAASAILAPSIIVTAIMKNRVEIFALLKELS